MLLLTKISDAKYIDDMYSNEYLYFKNLKEFKKNEPDESGRLDNKELNLKCIQIKNLTLKSGDKIIEVEKILKNFNAQYLETLIDSKISCCSLISIKLEENKSITNIDERIYKLGNKVLMIFDTNKLFEILDCSLESLNLTYSRKYVKYYNPRNFDGDLTLHDKDEKFSYQNEYRILIAPTENEFIKIPIKGLKEISVIFDIDKLEGISLKII